MKNAGLYGKIKMSLRTADMLVLATITLLIFTFVFAVATAEKSQNVSGEVTTADCFISPIHIPYTFSEQSFRSFYKTQRLIH